MTTNIKPPVKISDLGNPVRDLSDEMTTVMQTDDGILKYISETDRSFFGKDRKAEWLENVETYENDVLENGGAVAAADTTYQVKNIDRFDVGMFLSWHDYYETMEVTGVDEGTSIITVTRNYNGAGAVTTVADESQIDILNRAEKEYSHANEVGAKEPEVEYNFWEIFREDMPFSEMVANALQYGYATPEAFIDANIERYIRLMKNRLARVAIKGQRRQGTSTVAGTMRGIFTWLLGAGTNKTDGSTAAITAGPINDMLAAIYTDDTRSNSLILYMDLIQARAMAAFNTTLANRLETVNFDEQRAAGVTAVSRFIGDFQAFSNVSLVVDLDAPVGTLMALNTDKIKIVYAPNGRLVQWNSKDNDLPPDASRTGMIMTASLEMKDHKYSHGLLYNYKKT